MRIVRNELPHRRRNLAHMVRVVAGDRTLHIARTSGCGSPTRMIACTIDAIEHSGMIAAIK
jgi:hypothetical protein